MPASLVSLVDVDPLSPSTSRSRALWVPSGARGVFGGQVIAQSLSASASTVSPPLGLHSMHCYFLLPAKGSPEIEYRVEKLRDGRSYASRLVRAWQGDREVFVLLASYALPPIDLPSGLGEETQKGGEEEPDAKRSSVSHSLRFALPQDKTSSNHRNGTDTRQSQRTSVPPFQPRFQLPFPSDLAPWSECEEEEKRWTGFLSERGQDIGSRAKKFAEEYIQERTQSPVGIALARRKGQSAIGGSEPGERNRRLTWLRARLQEGEKPDIEVVKAMIAYMTDFQFIGTAARALGLTHASTPRIGMLASLDHSIFFYPFPEDFDASAPLLHVMESASADLASGRGVVRGLVYTQEGVLIAVTTQEGVIRADLKGLEAKGLVEGGAVGDVEGVKAKL